MKKYLLFFACMLFMQPAISQTNALRIDFGTSSSPVETDWQAMVFSDKATPSSEFTSFSAMGTTLQVKVSFIEEIGTSASTRSINRGGTNYSDEKYDLLTDWIAADVLGGTSRTLAIEVTGLPAGTYTWKSYHHDFGDQRGTFIGKIENNAGVISDYGSAYQISLSDPGMTTHPGYANTFLDVTQYFNDAIVSSGPTDVIKVYLSYEYPLGHESIDHPNKLLVINGFELYETPEVLPEIIHVTETDLSFNGSSFDEFYVTAEDLTENITITAPSGYTVTPSTLSPDVVNAKVDVTFDGSAASDGFITLSSGEGETTIAVSGTTYIEVPFKLDFNRTGTTDTENGWEVIQITDKTNPGSEYFTFSAMEGTVEVLPVWLNNPIDANTRAVNRNSSNYADEIYEVLDDYIAADALAGDPNNGDHCNTLAIKVKGIPAGSYSWKSYHHDNDNQRGRFTGSVTSTGGFSYTGTELTRISYSNSGVEGFTDNIEGVTTFETIFASTGVDDIITVSFTHEYPYADPYLAEGVQAEKFVVLNGFEIAIASNDATLSSLITDIGTLTPEFNPNITEYSLQVPSGTSIVNISAMTNDASATFTISDDGIINVNPGQQATVLVTAEDGTEKTYTITIDVTTNTSIIKEKEALVYPTISNSHFNVEAQLGSTLEVYDCTGTIIKSKTITSTKEILSINPKGLFIIKIKNKGLVSLFKVVNK